MFFSCLAKWRLLFTLFHSQFHSRLMLSIGYEFPYRLHSIFYLLRVPAWIHILCYFLKSGSPDFRLVEGMESIKMGFVSSAHHSLELYACFVGYMLSWPPTRLPHMIECPALCRFYVISVPQLEASLFCRSFYYIICSVHSCYRGNDSARWNIIITWSSLVKIWSFGPLKTILHKTVLHYMSNIPAIYVCASGMITRFGKC
jgi:hypothetical protein